MSAKLIAQVNNLCRQVEDLSQRVEFLTREPTTLTQLQEDPLVESPPSASKRSLLSVRKGNTK